MNPLQRVSWTEGMIMSPHHLQQQDLYHEALLDARLRALHPYAWGVVSQEIDAEALSAGQFQLQRFFGVLADGMVLSFERGQAEAPPPRPVDEHLKPSQRVLEVFLGVPKEREGAGSESSSGGPDRSTRFIATPRSVADLSVPESVISVSFSRRNVRVLFGSEPREDFEAIKIAELARDKTGVLRVSETYVPPCSRVDASPFLMNGMRALMRRVLARQRELAEARRHLDAASPELTASDLLRFLQLGALNALIPTLRHVLEAGDLSPLEVYLRLSACAGQLQALSAEGDPSGLPVFQFTQLHATFAELFTQLEELLRAVVLEQCLAIPLEPREAGFYLARLEDERLSRCPAFFLAVRSDLSERLVADQLPRLAKIACWDEVQHLVDSATSGIAVQVSLRPPPELPVRPGVVYFSLETLGAARWKSALRERSLAVYLPAPFDPGATQLELLAIPPPSER